MKIIPFDPKHLEEMEINWGNKCMAPIVIAASKLYAAAGPAFSGEDKGRIVGCAGLAELWPGVAHAWAIIDKNYPKLSVYRAIKSGMFVLAQVCKCHRIQTSTPAGFEAGHRMLRGLGFLPEGIMRSYGMDQSDYVQYAKVF